MRTPDGIGFEFDAGLIVIGLDEFPAAVASWQFTKFCAAEPCSTCSVFGACVAGGGIYVTDPAWDRGWSIYIPLKNKVCAQVEWEPDDGLSLRLYAPRLESRRVFVDDRGTLSRMTVIARTIVPWQVEGVDVWQQCESEWLAEYLRRVERFPVQMPAGGGRVRLISIRDVRVRPRGEVLT